MNVTPQLRAIVLIGVLAVLALGLGLLAMSHLGSKPAAAPAPIKLHHPHKVVTPAKAVHVRAVHRAVTHPGPKPLVAKKVKAATGTAVAPRTAVIPKAPLAPRIPVVPKIHQPAPLAAANGLPFAIANALKVHKVVVVALYQSTYSATAAQRKQALNGKSAAAAVEIDRLSLGEAAAGARDAKAGFVGIDVLSQREAGPLAALIGPLADPTVLVYKRPSTLTVTLAGFVDRATVHQAAAGAASAQ